MTQNQSTLNSHKIELEHSLQTFRGELAEVKNEVADTKNEMSEIKESMIAMKTMIHQLCDKKQHNYCDILYTFYITTQFYAYNSSFFVLKTTVTIISLKTTIITYQ